MHHCEQAASWMSQNTKLLRTSNITRGTNQKGPRNSPSSSWEGVGPEAQAEDQKTKAHGQTLDEFIENGMDQAAWHRSVAEANARANVPKKKAINLNAAPVPVGKLQPARPSLGVAEHIVAVPVPAPKQAVDQAARTRRGQDPLPEDATTAIIRNVPARVSQADLLNLWPPVSSYDFMYLPFDFKTSRSAGFVLVNFVSHGALLEFRSRWHGEFLVTGPKTKRLDVAAADHQGLEANLLSFRQKHPLTKVRDMRHHPVIINPDGTLADFQEVMEAIQCSDPADG